MKCPHPIVLVAILAVGLGYSSWIERGGHLLPMIWDAVSTIGGVILLAALPYGAWAALKQWKDKRARDKAGRSEWLQ